MSSSTGHRSGKLAAAKSEKDLLQDVLGMLLRDEDNKYCADCDAKSPRWASWNIGVFLCIRCAGIHRKLGVHISRVKSVNLDSWTAEQVAGVAAIGNSLARAAYEANVPDGFRRPQTDATLEQFIKAKYEEKRYLARDWVLPKPDPAAVYDLLKTNTAQRRAAAAANSAAADGVSPKLPAPAPAPARRSAGNTTAAVKPPPQAASQSKPEKPPPQQPQQPAPPSAVPQQPPPDLLGGLADDGFGDFSSGGGGGGGVVSSHANDLAFLSEGSATTATAADLFASDSSNSANTAAAPKKSMKDSIMALYGQQNTAAAAAASSGGGGFLAHNQQQQHFGGMQYSMSTPQLASVANSTGYQPMPQQQQQYSFSQQQQYPFLQQQHQPQQQQQQQFSALYSQTAGALYSTGGQFGPPQFGGVPTPSSQQQQQQQQHYGFQPPGYVNNQSAYLLQIQSQMAGLNFKGAANSAGFPQQQQQQQQQPQQYAAQQQSAFAAGDFWN